MYKSSMGRLRAAALPAFLLAGMVAPQQAMGSYYYYYWNNYSNSYPFQDVARYNNQRFDYEVIGNSESLWEARENCGKNPNTSAYLSISSEAKVVKAVLYWSGTTASSADTSVYLNGTTVNAQKSYVAKISNFGLYGASADVTSLVSGSGNYTVGGIYWDNYYSCASNSSYGGWSLVVVYEDPKLPQSNIVWRDGFEYSLTPNFQARNLNISVPGVSAASCKPDGVTTIIAWEGDNYKPEYFTINGFNEGSNEFNGFSTAFGRYTYNQDVDNYLLDMRNRSSVDIRFQPYFVNTRYGTAIEGLAFNAVLVKTNSEEVCKNPDPDPKDPIDPDVKED